MTQSTRALAEEAAERASAASEGSPPGEQPKPGAARMPTAPISRSFQGKKPVQRATGTVEHGRFERERGDYLRELLRLHDDLLSVGSIQEVLQRTLARLITAGYEGGASWLIEPGRAELTPGPALESQLVPLLSERAAFKSWSFERSHRDNICVQALFSRRVLLSDGLEVLLQPHMAAEQSRALARDLMLSSVAAVPVWQGNEPCAVIGIWTRRQLGDSDLAWLEHLGRIVESSASRCLAQARLAQLEDFERRGQGGLNTLFDRSVNPILLLDPLDGRVLRANGQAASFFGHEPGQMTRLSILDLKIGEGADSAAGMIYRIIDSGTLRLSDAAFKRRDSRVASATVVAMSISPESNPFGVGSDEGVILMMLSDTTERRAARGAIQQAYDRLSAYVEDLQRTSTEVRRERERAEEANRLKSEFLANMSHELRTPMNAIIGFTSRVLKTSEDRLNEREQRNLNIVLRNADRLLTMINDLLDYAKLDANRMEIKPEVLQVIDLIEECAELAEQIVRGKEIEVVLDCPRDFTIESDRDKIRQILLNLLSNAAKFTEKGAITISAQAVEADEGPRMVAISVRDTGIGIRPENLDLIFESFRQVDGSYTRKEGGTGLGLAITARLAELLGGRMSVSSDFGEGTTFTFLCPFEPPRRLVERGRRLQA